MSFFYQADNLSMSIICADLLHGEVGNKRSQLRSKRDRINDPLADQIGGQPCFGLDKPQGEIPVVFFVLLLRCIASPARSWVQPVVNMLSWFPT